MKKEVLIAIVVGFIIGLTITFGIYTANKALKQNQTSQPAAESTLPAPPLASPLTSLIINEPENNLALQDSQATVSGQTEPRATVAIISEEEEELVTADDKGLFSAQISLISGLNEIKIISLAEAGQPMEKIINVVYSTAQIE